MTHPTDFFAIFNRGQGLHTQESGDAGFSSNMDHKFSDDYSENHLPVAEKGISFVIPIPKEEPGITEKSLSHPLVFDRAAGPEAHPADEDVLKLPSVHATPPVLSEENPGQESVMVLPGTADITEAIPALPEKSPREETEIDAKMQENERHIKMNTEGKPAKQKHPPLEGRNWSRRQIRAMLLLCWMACSCVPVSEGLPVSAKGAQAAPVQKLKCFACMDEERCPKLMRIFHSDLDTVLYQRDLNETFPACLGLPPPGPEKCAVCRDFKITIFCPEDAGQMDVEDSDGNRIENVSPTCEQQPPGSACGLIPSIELFLIMVLGALVI